MSPFSCFLPCSFCSMLKLCDSPNCLRVQGVDLVFLRGFTKSACVRMESSTCQWPAWAPLAKSTAASASEAPEKATHPLASLSFILLLKSITESRIFTILKTKYFSLRNKSVSMILDYRVKGEEEHKWHFNFRRMTWIKLYVLSVTLWKQPYREDKEKIKGICFLAELLFSQMLMSLLIFLSSVVFFSHYM